MKRDRDGVVEGRADTDASLGVERATADAAIARAAANARRRLDALITRDRVLTDQRMTRFRQSADDVLAGERSASPAPSTQVVRERLAADGSKETERSVTDAVLQQERRRSDARGEARQRGRTRAQSRQETRRQRTNERLSDERNGADAIAADRDAKEQALDVAHGAEAGRTDVFAMVTHDLRNPLYAIVANAEVIAESAGNECVREAADDIMLAAARMGRLLTDLLDVASIDARTFRLKRRRHDLKGLLSEMCQSHRPLFEGRGVTLSVELPPAEVVASFDRDRVVQMLSNLLGNALQFTAPGGRVSLRAQHRDELIELVVEDDGGGIHPSAMPHLFERFWQADPDTRRGLGLGLYLCRTIARAHGGDISVQSEPGAGATFRVWLPTS